MEKSISCTVASPEHTREFCEDYRLLFEARAPTEIAAIYDRILERLSTLLVPRKERGDEYFDDQKFLYYAMVREIMASPDTELAMQRFKKELEDFFSKKPSFRWRGLGLKELLDITINIPLSLGDITKIVITKAGQFIIQKMEASSHAEEAMAHTQKETKEIIDGHLLSACREVLLPFLRSVRHGPEYDHPVVTCLYAYLMPILDRLCAIFAHTTHSRGKNIFGKILAIREELEAMIRIQRPPQNARQGILRLFQFGKRKKGSAATSV